MLKKTNEFPSSYDINNQDNDISRVEDLLGLHELNEYFSNSRSKSPLNNRGEYFTILYSNEKIDFVFQNCNHGSS